MTRLQNLLILTVGFISTLGLLIHLYDRSFQFTGLKIEQLVYENEVITEKMIFNEQEKWIPQGQGQPFANYGDGSCLKATNQVSMRHLFKRWMWLAGELNVRYSLAHGSLLGAWRDGGMIPYDTDIDVYIDINDMEKLENFFNKNETISLLLPISNTNNNSPPTSNRRTGRLAIQRDWRLPQDERQRTDCTGKVRDYMTDDCSFQEPVARLLYKEKMFVDIFAYNIAYNTVHGFTDEKLEIRVKDFLPLSKCMFLNLKTYCPQSPMAILKKLYKRLYPETICKNRMWIKQR